MKIVLQRVTRALVSVNDEVVGAIGDGFLALVGVGHDDGAADAVAMADKIAGLRVFTDDDGKMNLSVVDIAGSVLVVSQFTLLADTRKGRRPSFVGAARPEVAEPLIRLLVEALEDRGVATAEGRFGAMMNVDLVNAGPVTILLTSVAGTLV